MQPLPINGQEEGWVYIGKLYSQKLGKTAQLRLEKNVDPNAMEAMYKFRGVDTLRKLFIPIDTNNRDLRDGQLISIKGYEDANPFLVELAKSMKFKYNLAAY